MKQILFFFIFAVPIISWSNDNNDEDYDSIVRKLTNHQSLNNMGESIFDDVMFHVGLGISSSSYGLTVAEANKNVSKPGFSLALGVDLFSPKWLSEVVFTNYGDYMGDNFSTNLKEFDLKVIYKHSLSEKWTWRMGAGLAARYISLSQSTGFTDYTTPSSILLTGIEVKVSNQVSLMSEFGFRNPMITETPEKAALDLLFRIDGHL